MTDLRLKNIDETDIETLLGEDAHFEGEMSFDTPALIKGGLKGTIVSPSQLFVSESAQIDATITAGVISAKGKLKGEINATERLEIFADATISGKIRAADLIVQSGANINATIQVPYRKPAERRSTQKRSVTSKAAPAETGTKKPPKQRGKSKETHEAKQ